ncbi:phage tail fiber protein [bacterium]|jgi:hypothetical protein|nr:phage tail fiber protein [Candidatus Gracilibacteria bacterium]MDA7495983.1 phage tail fiber protein [bacterium]MDB4350154.1 phage tail fiber protein [bacterium]
MAFSYQNYQPTNNTTDTFSIPFTFTAQSEISVTVDGVAQTGLTFPSSSSVQLTSPVASGSLVQVRRTTSLTARAIDFASGSVLTEEDLDDSNIQVFHAAQEAIDTSNDSITLTPANRWDAGGSIINNVGTPTSNTDAATKAYADGISAAATAAATVAANAAVASATGNIIPDATKLAIHPIGSQYTLSDGTTTDYSAKHYQDAASTSATNAATSETNAGTSETNSQNWAVKTDGYAEGTLGYSSKAWAIGDTGGVSNTAGAGPAKDWATETATNVDGTEYSAKEYAIGSQAGNTAGSSKQWALGGGAGFTTSTTVDGTNYSAKYYAELAASNFDSFDDKFLGAKSSPPALDNDGNALIDGALYYDNTGKYLSVYDLGTTSWNPIQVGATAGFAIAMAVAL